MSLSILNVAIEHEADVVVARQRARRIAGLLGFGMQDQARISTAVSEIVRNAFAYAQGGTARFSVEGSWPAQQLLICVDDKGPGIADLELILSGRFRSRHGMGVGLTGSKRLMDVFRIETSASGTMVTLGKTLSGPNTLTALALAEIVRQLASEKPHDPHIEVREQNQELLRSLTELRLKQDETDRLNAELQATNRGVVALHAELDQKAVALEAVNEALAELNKSLAERIEAAVEARGRAEEGLRQSQKMEAVGQLTGGIAHDFNNLLQIVTGNLEILQRTLPEEATRQRRSANNAMEGARRAAVLTQRLLAFSRRQPLMPQVFEVNALVSAMVDLLARTIGEQVTITMSLEPEPWSVEVDPNQLENALLNLAVNARDAMGNGGNLLIATINHSVAPGEVVPGELEAGDYVGLRVTDDGCGMTPATIEKVFEPFFTTKDVGKGTGLGLSMVYGFVKQSGGHVSVVSTLGTGTTLTLYLPRTSHQVAAAIPAAAPGSPVVQGDAVILVVEDEAAVREHTVEVLRELGYTTLEAADGDAALSIIEAHPEIDLLFTDVVLPGRLMGREVADIAIRLRPRLGILFTTGYARNVVLQDGDSDAKLELINKPFSYDELAAKVRSTLARIERDPPAS